ncbi:Serine/threonine-protein phosphatase [Durusdinium trenchii]|uniref:Serine/threonine-protein phosphatase n=1 Tax=Durusdinium trenchii TaxID=1381693 RepID=A0ABP0JCA8_9DINO
MRSVWRRRLGSTAGTRSGTTSFLTDAEGHLGHWERQVRFSEVLEARNGADGALELRFREPHEQSRFVFGGDVVDHGPGDMRIANALVDFKQRHPDRVWLLAGNRDLNKLYLRGVLRDLFKRDPRGAVDVLKTTLKRKMGAPHAFEQRRLELGQIRGESEVSDLDVVQSFQESVEPGGFMLRFLQNAQLGLVLGDTLFVHGAVPQRGLGFVPGQEDRAPGPLTWMDRLNVFFRAEIDRFAHDRSDGRDLIEYSRPGGFDGRGVVYNSWLESVFSSVPAEIPEAVVSFLSRDGICRVLSGHRPHGDTPTVIRDASRRLSVVTSDISYADKDAADSRGKVVTETLVMTKQGSQPSTCRVRGVRRDDTKYDFVVEDKATPWLGRPTPKEWGIPGGHAKIALAQDECLVCQGKGEGFWGSDLNNFALRVSSNA